MRMRPHVDPLWNSDSQLAEHFLLLPTSARSQSGSLGRDVSRVDCTSDVLARPHVNIGASGLENCVARLIAQLVQDSRSPVMLHLCSTCTSEFSAQTESFRRFPQSWDDPRRRLHRRVLFFA